MNTRSSRNREKIDYNAFNKEGRKQKSIKKSVASTPNKKAAKASRSSVKKTLRGKKKNVVTQSKSSNVMEVSPPLSTLPCFPNTILSKYLPCTKPTVA